MKNIFVMLLSLLLVSCYGGDEKDFGEVELSFDLIKVGTYDDDFNCASVRVGRDTEEFQVLNNETSYSDLGLSRAEGYWFDGEFFATVNLNDNEISKSYSTPEKDVTNFTFEVQGTPEDGLFELQLKNFKLTALDSCGGCIGFETYEFEVFSFGLVNPIFEETDQDYTGVDYTVFPGRKFECGYEYVLQFKNLK